VGECFEKTLRYPGHFDLLCELKALGLFSSEKMKIGKVDIAPRTLMSKIFEGSSPARVPTSASCGWKLMNPCARPGGRGLLGGRLKGQVATFTLVDHYHPKTDMSAMMRTTAFPASIVLQMLASGAITSAAGCCRNEMFRSTYSSTRWRSVGSRSSTRSSSRMKPRGT
jgi:lysine 6-dehydrogenase